MLKYFNDPIHSAARKERNEAENAKNLATSVLLNVSCGRKQTLDRNDNREKMVETKWKEGQQKVKTKWWVLC